MFSASSEAAGAKGSQKGKGGSPGGKGAGGKKSGPNNRVLVQNFPASWSMAGKEILAEFIQSQLDSFGELCGPVEVSLDMSQAEVTFVKGEDAEEAISVLNNADLRGEEDKDQEGYTGLKLKALSTLSTARATPSNAKAVSSVLNGADPCKEEQEVKTEDNLSSAPIHVPRETPAITKGSGKDQTPTKGTAKGEAPTKGTAKGEAPTKGTAKGEAPTKGTAKGEAPTKGTAKGEAPTKGTAKGEAPTKGQSKGSAAPKEQPKLGSVGAPSKNLNQSKDSKPAPAKPALGGSHRYFEFAGTWAVRFEYEEIDEPGRWRSWDVNYKIQSNGEMKMGKRNGPRLVPACGPEDYVSDPNYTGKHFVLGHPHKGCWEYAWIEGGEMHVHHFSEEAEVPWGIGGFSPFNSPNFCIAGQGPNKDNLKPGAADEDWDAEPVPKSKKKAKAAVEEDEGPEKEDPADEDVSIQIPVQCPDLEGTWFRTFELKGERHDGGKFSIYENGEVKLGKKRRLQLAYAGSVDDVRQDPNYHFDGCFLLNKPMGKGTWEYMWMENGTIEIHNFGSSEKGDSPFGSPHFWGRGFAHDEKGGPKETVTGGPSARMAFQRPLHESAYAVGQGASLRDERFYQRPESGNASSREPTLRELLSKGGGGGKGGSSQGGSSKGKSWEPPPAHHDDSWDSNSWGPAHDSWGPPQDSWGPPQDSWGDDSWGKRTSPPDPQWGSVDPQWSDNSWGNTMQQDSWEGGSFDDSWGAPPAKMQRTQRMTGFGM